MTYRMATAVAAVTALMIAGTADLASARSSDRSRGDSLASGEKGEVFRITASNGYLVGGEGRSGDSMRYQGRRIWEGPSEATVIVNDKRNTGLVMGTVVTHGHTYTVIMNQFSGHKPFMSGGIAKSISLHGLTGKEAPILPKTHAYLAGWGKGCTVYKDDDVLYDNFRCHFMLTEGIRDPKSHRIPGFPESERVTELIQVRKGRDRNGEIEETKEDIRRAGRRAGPSGMQLHIIAHSGKKNPNHVPPYETAIHFMWDDVQVWSSPERLTRASSRGAERSARSDRAIRDEIERSLRQDMIEEENVDVAVRNGVVVLSGTVNSWELKQQAEQYAEDVRGVRRVRNKIDVEPSKAYRAPRVKEREGTARTSGDDRELKENIESELAWSPFVDSESIRVSVRNGVATLSGTVEEREEMQDAIENAYEAGASRVVNRIRVEERD